ncbi:MAG TPA: hypothetical protein VGT40_17385 [Methylomirabilota bacterium]|jgi:hypothetical protein|nr:hypothetical protein [Methylomirabilota bacterium]
MKLFVRELRPAVVMPLDAAAYCADCEAVFDSRHHRDCPSCASSVTVSVSSLINKSSLLAQPAKWESERSRDFTWRMRACGTG